MLIGPASLLSLLKAIYQLGEITREAGFAQSFATVNTHRNPSFNTSTTRSNNQEREEIPTRPEEEDLEDISIHFLCTYSTHPDWKQIVSTCNGYGQTLAHISVTLGYFRLLQHLFGWKIDLNVVDSMGLSALHYAYLFKQEECAKFLIQSGVNQFVLDDLGRSPSDLDPSLEIRLRSIMEKIDSDSNGASPNGYDTEIPDEAGKLYAKHFLIQQWMRQGEDERKGELPPSRYQSPENLGRHITASSPPAPDLTNEKGRGITHDRFPSLAVRIPEENTTLIVTDEMDLEVSLKIAAPTHTALPPSPISGASAQSQDTDRPSDIGQNTVSHPASLDGAIDTLHLEQPQRDCRIRPFVRRRLSLVSTATRARPLLPDAPKDIKEYNDEKRLQRSAMYACPSASPQRSMSGSSMEPTDEVALYNAREGVRQLARDHTHSFQPPIGDPAATPANDGTADQHAFGGSTSAPGFPETLTPLGALWFFPPPRLQEIPLSVDHYKTTNVQCQGDMKSEHAQMPCSGCSVSANDAGYHLPLTATNLECHPCTPSLESNIESVPGAVDRFMNTANRAKVLEQVGLAIDSRLEGGMTPQLGLMKKGDISTSANYGIESSLPYTRRTKTRRRGRLLPQGFETCPSILAARLINEGADPDAVDLLRQIIFVAEVTEGALTAPIESVELSLQYGGVKRKWHLLLQVTEIASGAKRHCCRLCPLERRREYENAWDGLRHLKRDHFGMTFVCQYW